LHIIDGRASYCVYATDNGNRTIWSLFRVAPVSVYIRSIYYVRKHVIYARRVYVLLRRVDRTRKNPLTTPHSTYHYDIYILHVVNAY